MTEFLRDTVDTSPATVALTGNDTLHIFTHYFDPSPPNVTDIDDFPLSQLTNFSSDASPWFGPSGHLGLGPNTPVLERLASLGEITTRSFGLYVGTAYPRAGGAINGSLTLGGYDSGRLSGSAHNFTLATDYDVSRNETPFRVTIESLALLDTKNGNTSIPLTNTSFDAYLTTDQFSMTFPAATTNAFVASTAAEQLPNDFSEPSFYLAPSTNYTLQITLSTGLTITIPPDELRNASNASPISAPLSPSSPALLGTAFLSHLYLTANYDATPSPSFHLNNALPHGPYVMTRPLCAASVPVMAEPVHISSFRAQGLIGAVLGGVIGGIGAAFALWWCWARVALRRRERAEQRRRDGVAEDEEMKGALGIARALGSPRSLYSKDGAYGPPGDAGAAAGGGTRVKLKGFLLKGGRRRGRDYKGKSRDVRYGDIDDRKGKKGSWSGSSDSDDHNGHNNGENQGYDMQQFSPVAVPAAYYGGHRSSPGGGVADDGSGYAHAAQQAQHAQHQHQYEAEGYMIGQAISTPPLDGEQRQQPRGNSHSDGGALRSISPVSPLSDVFATEPADYPLPASSHSKTHSSSSSPPPRPASGLRGPVGVGGSSSGGGGGGDGYADVPLHDDHGHDTDNDNSGDGSASASASFLGTPLGYYNSSQASSRPDLWLQTSREGVAFSGHARTAKKLKVMPVYGGGAGNGGTGSGEGRVRVVERVGFWGRK